MDRVRRSIWATKCMRRPSAIGVRVQLRAAAVRLLPQVPAVHPATHVQVHELRGRRSGAGALRRERRQEAGAQEAAARR